MKGDDTFVRSYMYMLVDVFCDWLVTVSTGQTIWVTRE